MTQVAIIQAAPKSNPADTTLARDTSTQFSPHLEKAIAKTTQNTSTTSSIKSNSTTDQTASDTPSLEAAEPLLENIALKEADQITAKDFFKQNLSEVIEPVSTSDTSGKEVPVLSDLTEQKTLSSEASGKESPVLSSLTEQKTLLSLLLETDGQKELSSKASGKEVPVLSDLTEQKILPSQVLAKKQAPQAMVEELPVSMELNKPKELPAQVLAKELPVTAVHIDQKTLSGQNVSEVPAMQAATKEFLPLSTGTTASPSLAPATTAVTPAEINIATTLPQNSDTPVSTVVQNNTLLQQLQQITMGNEIGTISIQNTVSTDSLQNPGETWTKPSWLMTSQIVEQGPVTEKPVSKISALRQDMLAQYFDAKIIGGEKTDSGQNTQNSDQQSSTNGQQSSTTLLSNSPLSPEQAGSFQHISTLIPDMQAGQTQNSIKPIILPTGTVVYEDDVIQQVTERFQINNRANGTKISLQLHPEELGEVKIDLTLKEGSIKANVVAQSQHVREIMERNMVKLRNILEDKGYTVEDIVVTSESDSVSDFDLFEQNFSQQEDFSVPTSKTQNQNGFDTILEEAVEQSIGLSTGVNIIA